MAPGSVAAFMPTHARVDTGWCQLNGSVAAGLGLLFVCVEELLQEWKKEKS